MYLTSFQRTLLSSCITAACTAVSMGASAETVEEELIVTGIRAAQESAVNIKRESASIVDAISAEDIGKLPDVTISDSLQRITGVQIRRSAGEGGLLNIRGMGQVLTTLNGESYLGANSITTVQPNFNDIPSQLFSGAEVVKSQTASHHAGGISGVVNLKTFRPFSFDDGLTLSGAIQNSYGEESQENDPSLNGLINWKGDRIGVMLSGSYSEANLANYYSGVSGGGETAGWTGFAGENWAYDWVESDTSLGNLGDRLGTGGVDVNGDGDTDDSFWAFQGHSVYNRFSERERTGLNFGLQADLGSGLELVVETLYTDMDEYDRLMGVSQSDKWQRWGWFTPEQSRVTGVQGNDRDLSTVQTYTGNGRRFKSYSSVQVFKSESTNFNAELNFDNDGAFTGQLRFVHGNAEQERLNSYMDIDLAAGNQWGVEFQNYDGGRQATNPNGYRGYPVLTVDYSGSNPHWSGFNNNANIDINGTPITTREDINGNTVAVSSRSMADYIADVNSYSLGALTSENNYLREGDMNVLKFSGNYEFSDSGFLTSVDFGVRLSQRSIDNYEFDLLSPIGDDACGVKWVATDVTLNGGGIDGACTYGDDAATDEVFYTAGRPTPITTLNPIQLSDFGETTGIPTVWNVDPASMDDVEGYRNNLYPGTYRAKNPGRSYEVDLDQNGIFAQANFEVGPVSGNLGLRYTEMDLTIKQNIVGAAQPYGAANADGGDLTFDETFSEVLPSLNVKYDINNNLVLRGSYSKTMAPLDLNQWGGGLAPNFAIDSDPNSETFDRFIVISASSDGNPGLEPWLATNYDISLEYYLGGASMLSAGIFYIDVDSFVSRGTVNMPLPDQDGVVRRNVDVNTNVQGDGGTLEGLELSARFAFSDFTDGFWSGFGTDLNYTYSPSESGDEEDMSGDELPFVDNSENIYNIVGWYENHGLQVRLAYNYRSERVVALAQTWGQGTLWQDDVSYIDASISYDILEDVSVFLNASNITGEKEEYYLEFEDQKAWQNEYEARYTIGVRATF